MQECIRAISILRNGYIWFVCIYSVSTISYNGSFYNEYSILNFGDIDVFIETIASKEYAVYIIYIDQN